MSRIVRAPARLVCLIVLFVLWPAEARADAINFAFIAVAGVAILVPLTAFVVLVEGVFIARGLSIPYRRTLLVLLVANLASLAAGIPVKIFNAWTSSLILPRPLAPYFRMYPLVALLGAMTFFLVTLAMEHLVIAGWCRRRAIPGSLGRIASSVLLANAVTYSILAPVHYLATRPRHDIREFTDDSRWARQPPATLYFVADSGELCSVMTDGQGRRVLVSDTVRDYQYLPDAGVVLYRNGMDDLCLFRKSDRQSRLIWETDQRFHMEQVAASPDGSLVAYCEQLSTLPKLSKLMLYEVETRRRTDTGIIVDDSEPEIAWSDKPFRLFLRSGRMVDAVTIDSALAATRVEMAAIDGPLARVYGRFSTSHRSGGGTWSASFGHDEMADKRASAPVGLRSYLLLEVDGASVVLADNPGFLGLARRWFNDICFLDGGGEVVFDDHRDIYLLDVDRRRVGRIVEGSNFMILSPRYGRTNARGGWLDPS